MNIYNNRVVAINGPDVPMPKLRNAKKAKMSRRAGNNSISGIPKG